jgi:hypothetical protein
LNYDTIRLSPSILPVFIDVYERFYKYEIHSHRHLPLLKKRKGTNYLKNKHRVKPLKIPCIIMFYAMEQGQHRVKQLVFHNVINTQQSNHVLRELEHIR